MNTYIFFREDGWYPMEFKDDAEAIANAECNPGTIRVEDAVKEYVVWKKK